jgi:nitroreductase
MVDDVTEFLSSRHSVRDFLPDPVSPKLIDQILHDGLSAPSWSNTRPYRIAIATGTTRDAISADLMRHFHAFRRFSEGNWWQKVQAVVSGRVIPWGDFRVPLKNPDDLQPRRIALAKKLFGHVGIERADIAGRNDEIGRNFEFFGAPVALFVFARSRMGVYSPLDAGFFAQNLLLSAARRGLGACAQGFLAVWSRPVRKHFDIPRGYKLLFGISLGYPSHAHINDFRPPETTPAEITLRKRAKDNT